MTADLKFALPQAGKLPGCRRRACNRRLVKT